MSFEILYLPCAEEDLALLDGSVRIGVIKAIDKVSQNPLPKNEGGYGNPLGNKRGMNLTGLCKVKLKGPGIRVVYKVEREDGVMKIIIIGVRTDDEVYRLAARRREQYGL